MTFLKRVSNTILTEGGKLISNSLGVVRNVTNLGDRVLSKNIKDKSGQKFGVGRYISVTISHLINLDRI